mmetsp:Transcript_14310/g.40755  ORF Transcript_14310/g.40755 Transcript_14310/m.40755 type:complete len:325 (-) Transcript_14310:145-1119(-)
MLWREELGVDVLAVERQGGLCGKYALVCQLDLQVAPARAGHGGAGEAEPLYEGLHEVEEVVLHPLRVRGAVQYRNLDGASYLRRRAAFPRLRLPLVAPRPRPPPAGVEGERQQIGVLLGALQVAELHLHLAVSVLVRAFERVAREVQADVPPAQVHLLARGEALAPEVELGEGLADAVDGRVAHEVRQQHLQPDAHAMRQVLDHAGRLPDAQVDAAPPRQDGDGERQPVAARGDDSLHQPHGEGVLLRCAQHRPRGGAAVHGALDAEPLPCAFAHVSHGLANGHVVIKMLRRVALVKLDRDAPLVRDHSAVPQGLELRVSLKQN